MDAKTSPTDKKLAYTVDAAAAEIGVSRATLYNLFRSGDLTPRKLGRRTLITGAELARYLESLPAGVAAA